MTAIQKLRNIARLIEQRPELIQQARDENATWDQIADALNMSRAGVIKLYNASKDQKGKAQP